MIINGVELEFNLYDLENPELKERYRAELEKMKHVVAREMATLPYGNDGQCSAMWSCRQREP